MKRGASRCGKMRDLAELLGIERTHAAGLMNDLWEWAAADTPQGNIGRFSDRRIAESIEWKGDPEFLVSCLVASKFVDPSEEFRLVLHDWWEHCEDSVHQRLAKTTQLFCDGRRPKLTKFSISERKQLLRLYEDRARALLSAPTALFCAPAAHFSANQAKPSLTRPSLSTAAGAATEKRNYASAFPNAAAAITTPFPETGQAKVAEIIESAVETTPNITDEVLAGAITATQKRGQRSAALWLHTLPAYLANTKEFLHAGPRLESYDPNQTASPPPTDEERVAELQGFLALNGVEAHVATAWRKELDELLAHTRKPPKTVAQAAAQLTLVKGRKT